MERQYNITLVCPGFIKTQVSVNALTGKGDPLNEMDNAQENGMPPDKCANHIINAIRNKKQEVYIGGKETYAVYLKRWFPSIFSSIIKKSGSKINQSDMKNIINIVLTVLFILFALVQFNDPDPYVWILIYGSIALVSGLAIKNIYNKNVLLAMMVASIIGSIYYFPGLIELVGDHKVSDLTKTMKAEQPFIEESRESLGLLLGFLALCIIIFMQGNTPRRVFNFNNYL